MAINFNAIKTLFKKLAPVSDDIAKGVVNYGDDVAKAVVPYADDAAKAVTTYGDDVTRAIATTPPASVANLQAQQNLKNDLIYKRSPADHFDFIEPPAAASKESYKFIEGFNNPMTWGRFPRYTKTLGSVETDLYDIGNSIKPKGGAVNVPEMPTSGLVVNRGQVDSWRPRGFELRPHKNTAFGRWYAEHMPSVDATRKNPPLKKLPTFLDAADYNDFVNYLDTEDMLKRVKDATYGSIPGVSDADALAYVSEIPNLSYVDPKTLEYLNDSLSRHYTTSKNLQDLFGNAPSAFLSNAEYEDALQKLFDTLNKIPF